MEHNEMEIETYSRLKYTDQKKAQTSYFYCYLCNKLVWIHFQFLEINNRASLICHDCKCELKIIASHENKIFLLYKNVITKIHFGIKNTCLGTKCFCVKKIFQTIKMVTYEKSILE